MGLRGRSSEWRNRREFSMKILEAKYEVVIGPEKKWRFVDWKEIFQYRDLLYLLVKRELVAKYKQTVLGPLWYVVQPLMTTAVFAIVFGKLTKISTQGLPPILFYLCGLLPWGYFAQCLNTTSQTLIGNVYLFGKVYFPRLVVPLAAVLSNLLIFMIQLVTFLVFYGYFLLFRHPSGPDLAPSATLLVLPLLVLETACLSLGVGLWISSLTIKYRDFQHLLGFLTQLWMYATPIIYPSEVIPNSWRPFLYLNPLAPIVELFRYSFFGVGVVSLSQLITSCFITAVFLVSGILVFNRVERTFVDTV